MEHIDDLLNLFPMELVDKALEYAEAGDQPMFWFVTGVITNDWLKTDKELAMKLWELGHTAGPNMDEFWNTSGAVQLLNEWKEKNL